MNRLLLAVFDCLAETDPGECRSMEHTISMQIASLANRLAGPCASQSLYFRHVLWFSNLMT